MRTPKSIAPASHSDLENYLLIKSLTAETKEFADLNLGSYCGKNLVRIWTRVLEAVLHDLT